LRRIEGIALAELAIFSVYLISLVLALLWAAYRIVLYVKTDMEREQRLFDLMSNQDFRVYAERLKQEHDTKVALQGQNVDDAEANSDGTGPLPKV
jgi:hypothetical protein